MRYLKLYEDFEQIGDTLIVVDVQKSFRKYFSEMYLNELKKYCETFQHVYQIFDNHVDGKDVDKQYLYDENPEIPIHDDLYHFPNQKDLIEKRYNYDVDSDFYNTKMKNSDGNKGILDEKTYKLIKSKELDGTLQKGECFETKEGTLIVYIGNNHRWFHVPIKLYKLLLSMKGKEVIIVGGSDSECLEDIITTAEKIGVNIKRNWKYIYSANHCPIK
jgi:hypothetical protein